MDYENRVNRTEESEKEIEIKDGVPVAAKLEAIKNQKKAAQKHTENLKPEYPYEPNGLINIETGFMIF
ncbi:MAG: hypothetical protein JXL81_11420 [Deltaproteobacteria bacterium]|nr:hypothetical protein [Deltaproteobacteria bacterium]